MGRPPTRNLNRPSQYVDGRHLRLPPSTLHSQVVAAERKCRQAHVLAKFLLRQLSVLVAIHWSGALHQFTTEVVLEACCDKVPQSTPGLHHQHLLLKQALQPLPCLPHPWRHLGCIGCSRERRCLRRTARAARAAFRHRPPTPNESPGRNGTPRQVHETTASVFETATTPTLACKTDWITPQHGN